jgi:membrane associated rhomboid family serine protease
MNGLTSKGLRIVLLIDAVFFAVYGLLHIFSPEMMLAVDPAIERVLGAAALAFAIGAFLAYLERSWEKVRIAVVTQAVWMVLYTLTMVWGLAAGGIAAAAWGPALIGALFAVLLAVLSARQNRIQSQA